MYPTGSEIERLVQEGDGRKRDPKWVQFNKELADIKAARNAALHAWSQELRNVTYPPSEEFLSMSYTELMQKMMRIDQVQDGAIERYRNLYFIELDRSFAKCELASLDAEFVRHALHQERLRRVGGASGEIIAELDSLKEKGDKLISELSVLDSLEKEENEITIPRLDD